jgi:hypothetical protein
MPHALTTFCFFLILYICIQIPNFFLAYLIITKKNHYENIKKPLEASFNYFFASKNILVISLFFFAIVIQILNCLLTKLIITKKLLWKYKKPLKAFFIFFQRHFGCFTVLLKCKKTYFPLINLTMTIGPYERTSIPLTTSFKYFDGMGKKMKTQFQ